MQTANNELVYSVTETAAVLKLSRPSVYNLIRSEGFPSFKVGNRTLISVEGLREWVARQAGVEEAVQ